MKLVIFSSNTKCANVGLKELINKRHEDIKAFIIVDKIKGRITSKLKLAYKYLKKFSLYFLMYKLYDGFGGNKVIKLVKHYKIPVIKIKNINDDNVLKYLKKINPDLTICFFIHQILKKNLISIPKYGTLNAHGSLLPKYKGAAQYFWYLYNGDKTGGITIHYMEEGLDTGDIILQKSFLIEKNDSMFSVHMKIGNLAAKLFDDVIDLIKNGTVKPIKQKITDSHYLTLPTNKEMKKFKEKKLKIFSKKLI